VDPITGLDDVEKRKFLTLPGLELEPVASRYTDYHIPAPIALFAYSGGWSPNWVHSAPRPFTVLLCLPRVIVGMENYSVE
jgi:hypothetical protein